MEPAKVYFSDLRCRPGRNLLQKLERLIRTAGIGEIDFEGKLTAIKMHFGEPGNLAFLRPNYAKVVADVVRSMGGLPFLTDCNTLYPGRRKNALEHLDAAFENGFSPQSTGCQIIIGDGLRDGGPGSRGGAHSDRQNRQGHYGGRRDSFPEPLQGPRADRLWRRGEKPGHGLRKPPGQDGAACGRQAHGSPKNTVSAAASAPFSAPTTPLPTTGRGRPPLTTTNAWAAAGVLPCAIRTQSGRTTTAPWRSWGAVWPSTPRRWWTDGRSSISAW